MATFDVQAALKDGVPEADIAAFLAKQANFDLESARGDGVKDSDVIARLAGDQPKPVDHGFLASGQRQLAKRGVGIIQNVAELFPADNGGIRDTILEGTYKAAQKLNRESADDSLVGQIAADPLLNLRTRLGLAGTAAAAGGASGFLDPLEGPEGSRFANTAQGTALGAVGGKALGALGSKVAGGVGAVASRLSPSVDSATADLAQKALNFGIPLRASQISSSRPGKILASVSRDLPFSGAEKFNQKQVEAFNRAAVRTVGENADSFTPEVINNAYANIGKRYDDILAGKTIKVGDDFVNQLADIEAEAGQNITDDHARLVRNQLNRVIGDIADDGTISGEKIGSLRSSLRKAAEGTSGDAKPYIQRLHDAVLDAGVSGSPADRAALLEANAQYRALKTIEPLAAKAEGGMIAPGQLQGAVTATKAGKSAQARGRAGDLGDLARIGKQLIQDRVPNSATASRAATLGFLGGSLPTASSLGGVVGGRAFNAIDTSLPNVQRVINRGLGVSQRPILPMLSNGAQEAIGAEIGVGLPRIGLPSPVSSAAASQPLNATFSVNEPIDREITIAKNPTKGRITVPNPAPPKAMEGLLDRIAFAESRGNPNARNPNGSASGLFGLIDSTRASLVRKYGDLPDDELAALLTGENTRGLTKILKREPTDGEVYAAHFLGLPDARKLLKAPDTQRADRLFRPRVSQDNRTIFYDGNRARSVGEIKALLADKVGAIA